jgi:hypothetical protein
MELQDHSEVDPLVFSLFFLDSLVAAVPAEYLLLSVVFVLSPGFRILYSHSNSQSAGGTQEP